MSDNSDPNIGDKAQEYLDKGKPLVTGDFFKSEGEFYQFLLGGIEPSENVHLEILEAQVEELATGSRLNERERQNVTQSLREGAIRKAREDALRYNLKGDDAIALEQLYLGFTQAGLLENGEGYSAKITEDTRTTYPSSGKRERIKVSNALWNVILAEFNETKLLDKGTQIRRSSDELFSRTAIQGLAIVSVLNTDPMRNKAQVLDVAPIHEVKKAVSDFRIFKYDVVDDI